MRLEEIEERLMFKCCYKFFKKKEIMSKDSIQKPSVLQPEINLDVLNKGEIINSLNGMDSRQIIYQDSRICRQSSGPSFDECKDKYEN